MLYAYVTGIRRWFRQWLGCAYKVVIPASMVLYGGLLIATALLGVRAKSPMYLEVQQWSLYAGPLCLLICTLLVVAGCSRSSTSVGVWKRLVLVGVAGLLWALCYGNYPFWCEDRARALAWHFVMSRVLENKGDDNECPWCHQPTATVRLEEADQGRIEAVYVCTNCGKCVRFALPEHASSTTDHEPDGERKDRTTN